MVRALALETSGRLGSVALVEDGNPVAEDHFPHGLKHTAELIPMIDRLIQARGWLPSDLQEVYVSIGPGSFTGLRVGVTIAKTLALSIGAKIVAVPTVEVLARNAPDEATQVVVVLDAKRDQIFTATLTRADAHSPWMLSNSARADSLSSVLAACSKPVHLIGEGIPYHEKHISKGHSGIIVTSPELWRTKASEVARIGWRLRTQGEFADPDRLTPLYIRKPEAEEKLEAARST